MFIPSFIHSHFFFLLRIIFFHLQSLSMHNNLHNEFSFLFCFWRHVQNDFRAYFGRCYRFYIVHGTRGFSNVEELNMKIIEKKHKGHKEFSYQFVCPKCGSTLEAKRHELHTLHWYGRLDGYVFFCPVCKTERRIRSGALKIVEGNSWKS